MERTITLEQKLAAMREVQRIYALAQKWRPVMPNQKRPNFEAQADGVMKRAMSARIVGRALPLEIQDGRLMHEHEPRTARMIERTLRNGIVHPDVLHSFQSGRTLQAPSYPAHRLAKLPPDPHANMDFNLYIQHSDEDLHYPSHFVPGHGFVSRNHVEPSHTELEQAADSSVVPTQRDFARPQAGPAYT